ncbi:MAG: class I SAM-dependent methyltransferase [Anaerolineae bacterium]|nr:class I SAM-dependent methyltransferase [Anaerolineae bacterium]
MTRKLKRTRDYEAVLDIRNDLFIAPPRPAQRNWLLNKLMAEFAYDLEALNEQAKKFVTGAVDVVQLDDRTHIELADEDIMEDWQIPLMQAMAEEATITHGDVLEIGFGLGVGSNFIQACGVKSHTIVEVNDSVVERFHQWRENYPDQDIRLLHGLWQDKVPEFGQYDGIFFHTYPLNEADYIEQVLNSVTFAEHFFPVASAHLRPGGVFSYMTNEIDSLSRAHQRLIFKHFSSFALRIVKLNVPDDVRDTWWSDQMAVVRAVK